MKKRNYLVDPRRPFSPDQKRKIWENQGKRCFICKEPLTSVEAEFQHRKWIKGGKTTTKNGRAVHPKCNTETKVEEDADDSQEEVEEEFSEEESS